MTTHCLVHIIDDEAAVRDSCAFLMEAMGFAYQTWEDGQAFLNDVDVYTPAVALIDLRMPHVTGEELVRRLHQDRSVIGQIVLTGHGDVDTAVSLLKLGVVDFLQKPIAAEKLQDAIERAWQHAQAASQKHQWHQYHQQLTPKEVTVAKLMVTGMTNKDMAEYLHVSQRTIEVHRSQVMAKFHCEHIAQLVHIYLHISTDLPQ